MDINTLTSKILLKDVLRLLNNAEEIEIISPVLEKMQEEKKVNNK